jgi:hypothetical protein
VQSRIKAGGVAEGRGGFPFGSSNLKFHDFGFGSLLRPISKFPLWFLAFSLSFVYRSKL